MDNLPILYISPLNEPILDAACSLEGRIGFLFSQRQYNMAGGYVSKSIISYLDDWSWLFVTERDHFNITGYDDALVQHEADFFNIIHIDPWFETQTNMDVLNRYVSDIIKANPKMMFEFGTEDYVKKVDADEYEAAYRTFDQHKDNFRYMVCQGGSVVFNLSNVSPIDETVTRRFVSLAKKHNLMCKRHNCDFHTDEDLARLSALGIAAYNYAPEMALISNQVVCEHIHSDRLLSHINQELIENAPWTRWTDDPSQILVSCLHYSQNEEVKQLIAENYHEIEEKVRQRLVRILEVVS